MNLNNFKELKELMSFLKEHPNLTVEDLWDKFAEPESEDDWEPKVGYNYSFLRDDGTTTTEQRFEMGGIYEYRFSQGNVFQPNTNTVEKYASYKKAKAELLALIKKLNKREGWVADFTDSSQEKGLIHYDNIQKNIWFGVCSSYQCVSAEFYFNPSLGKEIIATLGEEKIKLAITGG